MLYHSYYFIIDIIFNLIISVFKITKIKYIEYTRSIILLFFPFSFDYKHGY